jgi:DUF4097 and DUF4098 domain-containing protein YvlB
MKKTIKIWLAVAALLVVLGMGILISTACAAGWDWKKFSTEKYETNTYEITEAFEKISMETDTADIVFAPSDNGKCKVVCYEQEKVKHSVSAANGVLTINAVDARKWYEHIGINFETEKITVYLPESEYFSLMIKESTGDIEIPNHFKFKSVDISLSTGNVKFFANASETVKIKTSTGDIYIKDVSVNELDLSVFTGNVTVSNVTCNGDLTVGVSTGNAYLKDIACKNLVSSGNTGDISLKNVIASEKFSIQRSTGDVQFDGCDATEIFVKTDTSDVFGTLLSAKIFITKTNTGDIKVPQTVSGGVCEITTNTGDIQLELTNN